MYETFTPFPDINSVNDILRIILRGSPRMNYNRIGKFLSSMLVKTQQLFIEVQVEIECGCIHIFPCVGYMDTYGAHRVVGVYIS